MATGGVGFSAVKAQGARAGDRTGQPGREQSRRYYQMKYRIFLLALTGLLFALPLVMGGNPAWAGDSQSVGPINNPNPGATLWRTVHGPCARANSLVPSTISALVNVPECPPGTSDSSDIPVVTQVQGHDSDVLVNQEGSLWTAIRMDQLVPKSRDWLLFVLLLLGLVYIVPGPARLENGESGRQIERHNVTARFIHWFVAVIFIVLAVSGLILLLGRVALIPLLGKSAFGAVASFCKEVHNFLGPLFPLAIILLFFNLVRHNIYERGDMKWIAKGGGFFGGGHASAGRFNPGEKLLFWLTIFLGIGVSVTGYILDFPVLADLARGYLPELGQYRHVMELSHVLHTVIAIVFILLILGHIFLATLFVPGTLGGMTHGKVDENWASTHHDRWYRAQKEKDQGAA
ncbi:MAG TPA: formate dehydrogenase subunit gamma [Arenicellales bacterium]|jgi:formate dehydrogenase subunit gamma|nr:formate dehydrogenase subunit gamma [Acidiferrobacteraceae bacterium]MDP6137546.1 formate dehydrogenase subunit gamma [Arenicellales bacterium]HJP10406.1 formate dehydrogenase subunit gamma [Arenicellales bacterium]|tara:strand:- start:2496 stop:3704 length:1209 start_codon:yes stop_codon:yes gene_type:complete